MELRPYQPSDHDQVVRLWSTVFPDSTGHRDPVVSIERKLALADGLLFVAEDSGNVIGTVMAGYDGHRGWLYSVAVATEYRRRGVATALVRHAEKALAELGCPKINLQILPQNAAVVAFYESLGYHIEERISMGKLLD